MRYACEEKADRHTIEFYKDHIAEWEEAGYACKGQLYDGWVVVEYVRNAERFVREMELQP